MRDDFSRQVKETVARRVGYHCSNPDCRKLTSGPQQQPDKALSIGVAAHITAAASNGPRYDPSLSARARTSLTNALWLCQNCAKLIDSDLQRYTVALLNTWKEQAEVTAQRAVAGTEAITPKPVRGKPVAYRYTAGSDPHSKQAQHNILYTSNIIGAQIDELEHYFGTAFDIDIVNIGSLDDIPAGGEIRWYHYDRYVLSIGYDKQGIAKSVRIEELAEHGYRLYEWFDVLLRLGISIAAQPDILGIMSATWLNYHGYHITVALDKVDGVINIVRVFSVSE